MGSSWEDLGLSGSEQQGPPDCIRQVVRLRVADSPAADVVVISGGLSAVEPRQDCYQPRCLPQILKGPSWLPLASWAQALPCQQPQDVIQRLVTVGGATPAPAGQGAALGRTNWLLGNPVPCLQCGPAPSSSSLSQTWCLFSSVLIKNPSDLLYIVTVSYTHLTLPTILLV